VRTVYCPTPSPVRQTDPETTCATTNTYPVESSRAAPCGCRDGGSRK